MGSALAYFALVTLANLTATFFVGVPLGPLGGIEIAIGTVVFGFTFTQRDRMHRLGRPFVYAVILGTAVANVLLVLAFARWVAPGLAEAWAADGRPWLSRGASDLAATSARVLGASFLAIVLAESADTEVYHRLRERSWAIRVLGSNAVSIPLDTLVFNLLAFAGIFPPGRIAAIIAGDLVVKFLVASLWALRGEPQAGRAAPRA